jgi:hypothetical protein
MSIQVFSLTPSLTQDNRYTTGRTETWTSKPDKAFPTFIEATDYIYNMTRIHVPYFSELARGFDDEKRQSFLHEFCFTNDMYLKYRRFFIGSPPLKEIKLALQEEGIHTV